MKVLTTPPLVESMLKKGYWPDDRKIAQPQNAPMGMSIGGVREPIFAAYMRAQKNGIHPQRLADGDLLPRGRQEGRILKVVIDELQSTAVRGVVRPFVQPAFGGGKRLNTYDFETVAQRMINDPWYNGRPIQHRYKEMTGKNQGWHVLHQLTRRTAYVVPVGGSEGGWFKGVKAPSMRSSLESILPPLTYILDREDECFATAVGDVTVFQPEDSPLHTYTHEFFASRLYAKLSAAFVFEP